MFLSFLGSAFLICRPLTGPGGGGLRILRPRVLISLPSRTNLVWFDLKDRATGVKEKNKEKKYINLFLKRTSLFLEG